MNKGRQFLFSFAITISIRGSVKLVFTRASSAGVRKTVIDRPNTSSTLSYNYCTVLQLLIVSHMPELIENSGSMETEYI